MVTTIFAAIAVQEDDGIFDVYVRVTAPFEISVAVGVYTALGLVILGAKIPPPLLEDHVPELPPPETDPLNETVSPSQIGIRSDGSGSITIKVDVLENPPLNTEVYIRDNATLETYEIVNGSFEVDMEKGEFNDHYSIVFVKKAEEPEEIIPEDAVVLGVTYYKTRMLTVEDIVKATRITLQSLHRTHVGPIEFSGNCVENNNSLSSLVRIQTVRKNDLGDGV